MFILLLMQRHKIPSNDPSLRPSPENSADVLKDVREMYQELKYG
jgi:hypothetical protein